MPGHEGEHTQDRTDDRVNSDAVMKGANLLGEGFRARARRVGAVGRAHEDGVQHGVGDLLGALGPEVSKCVGLGKSVCVCVFLGKSVWIVCVGLGVCGFR